MDAALMVPLAASILVCAAVLLLAFGVRGARRESELSETLAGKIQRLSGSPHAVNEAENALERLRRLLPELAQGLGRLLGPKDNGGAEQLRLDLIRAGLRTPNAAQIFHGAKAALALGPAALFLAVALLLPKPPGVQTLIIGGLALALVGNFIPGMWLRGRVTERQRQLLCELPDALDLLVVCVEAGMGLDQAICRVSEELCGSAPLICGELKTMTLEMRAGRQRQQSLKDLAERTGLEDVQSLVTLLIQADLFGISVARTLRVYSDTLRTGRFQRAEEMAAKLPTKLMFPLILCIFPALFVVIMGPAGIQLSQVFSRMGQ